MKDALREAEKALDAEMTKQVDMIYSAMALALKRYWGWGKRRTLALMEETDKVWGECSGTNKKSMIQMLEEETGIEIRNHEQGKSWHDLAFLNADIDMRRMTRAQWIYMRQKQKDWIGPPGGGVCAPGAVSQAQVWPRSQPAPSGADPGDRARVQPGPDQTETAVPGRGRHHNKRRRRRWRRN